MAPLHEDPGFWVHFPGMGNPQVWLPRAWVCAKQRLKEFRLGQQVVKCHPPDFAEGDKKDGCGLCLGSVCF
jgi:hypothetical protein